MKIGIIGGNGYLGTKLANYLLKKKIYFEIFDVKKNKEFQKKGGKFLIPFPKPRLL